MKSFLQRWVVIVLAVLVTANTIHGIRYDSIEGLLVATLLLSALNAFVRPMMMLLSLPFLILTLGLFMFVINALLLYWVGRMKSFHVDTFSDAFWGSLLISLVSLFLNAVTGTGKSSVKVKVNRSRPKDDRGSDGGGPVIDV